MKKGLFILFIFCVLRIQANSQNYRDSIKNGINISYYWAHIGSNIAINYFRNCQKSTFVLGLKYHLNPNIQPSAESGDYAYYRKFYADNFAEHFGINIGYEYHLDDINPYVSPYLLYNLQGSYIKLRRDFIEHIPSSGISILITKEYKYGPYLALETTLGAGLSIKLTDKIRLYQSAGIGIAIFTVKNGMGMFAEDKNKYKKNISELDGMYLLQLGLIYNLK